MQARIVTWRGNSVKTMKIEKCAAGFAKSFSKPASLKWIVKSFNNYTVLGTEIDPDKINKKG